MEAAQARGDECEATAGRGYDAASTSIPDAIRSIVVTVGFPREHASPRAKRGRFA